MYTHVDTATQFSQVIVSIFTSTTVAQEFQLLHTLTVTFILPPIHGLRYLPQNFYQRALTQGYAKTSKYKVGQVLSSTLLPHEFLFLFQMYNTIWEIKYFRDFQS